MNAYDKTLPEQPVIVTVTLNYSDVRVGHTSNVADPIQFNP